MAELELLRFEWGRRVVLTPGILTSDPGPYLERMQEAAGANDVAQGLFAAGALIGQLQVQCPKLVARLRHRPDLSIVSLKLGQ